MQPKVSILLNEREALKKDAAALLESVLRSRNITVSRLPVTENPAELVIAGQPWVLVLDYLLGDFTTGLDVLENLSGAVSKVFNGSNGAGNTINPATGPTSAASAAFSTASGGPTLAGAMRSTPQGYVAPDVVFFTDEPSVQVAVQALRLGARHYVEMTGPGSVQSVADEIESILAERYRPPTPRLHQFFTLRKITGISPATVRLRDHARSLALRNTPINVVVGKAGSGRSSIARAIAYERVGAGRVQEVDCRSYWGSYDAFIGSAFGATGGLGTGLSLLVQHIDDDDDELRRMIVARKERVWPPSLEPVSHLWVTTASDELARRWVETLGAAVLRVPSLEERLTDFPLLVDECFKEAQATFGSRGLLAPDAKLADALSTEQWPGEVKELNAVLMDAFSRSQEARRPLLELVKEAKADWEYFMSAPDAPVGLDPMQILFALDRFQGNRRKAAAYLGVSKQKLDKWLPGGTDDSHQSSQ